MNPARDPKRAGLPDDWLLHATSDLNGAKALRLAEGVLPEQVCFHAQQAAEKALKAVILQRGAEFRRTHDIEQLIETVVRTGLAVPAEFDDAGSLTAYAVESRYPGGWGEIAATDIDEAIELAERVVNWAVQIVSPEPE